MLEYALRRLKQLKDEFDPSTAALGRWLAIVNVCIVIVAVGGVSLYAVDMLREQADAQGKFRALLMGTTAREELRRVDENTLTAAVAEYARSPARRAFLASLLNNRLGMGSDPAERQDAAV